MTLTIRSKVLLLSLALFSIPYVGYEYVREMEKYLRDNLESSLDDTARALSSILNDRPSLFSRHLINVVQESDAFNELTLSNPIQLDGNIDDWTAYTYQTQQYAATHILKTSTDYVPNSLSFQHVAGKYRGHLYALFKVTDETLVYRSPSDLDLDRSDHLQIVFQDQSSKFHHYIIPPTKAGWVSAYKVDRSHKAYSAQPELSIQGTWSETKTGYNLELRIPLELLGGKIGFAIGDVDNPHSHELKTVITTVNAHQIDNSGHTFINSPEVKQVINAIGNTLGRRIWVIDNYQRILAHDGDLNRDFPYHPLNNVFSLLLQPVFDIENDLKHKEDPALLPKNQIAEALKGETEVHWRATSEKQIVIVSAAHPIWVNKKIIGAVIVEETSHSIQTIQRQAITNLFNKTLLVFSVVTLLLLIFSHRLSLRLRRLRNQAETAIDSNGRVVTTKIGSRAKDEIGDLSRSFCHILERLQQYHNYLEGMASKLSHELRTPIAVVKSSLENLEQESIPEETTIYIERAKEGIERLNRIIIRLSETTRLEQSLHTTEKERFNLTEVIRSCMAGYRLAYPDQGFNVNIGHGPIFILGAPDLIAQMLDKLISNAVDFSKSDTAIDITLRIERNQAKLKITNYGIQLPEGTQERLFESMVSLRPAVGHEKEPHLGLGLYMVRLIINYHEGKVKASNNVAQNSVTFSVSLPEFEEGIK